MESLLEIAICWLEFTSYYYQTMGVLTLQRFIIDFFFFLIILNFIKNIAIYTVIIKKKKTSIKIRKKIDKTNQNISKSYVDLSKTLCHLHLLENQIPNMRTSDYKTSANKRDGKGSNLDRNQDLQYPLERQHYFKLAIDSRLCRRIKASKLFFFNFQ